MKIEKELINEKINMLMINENNEFLDEYN